MSRPNNGMAPYRQVLKRPTSAKSLSVTKYVQESKGEGNLTTYSE